MHSQHTFDDPYRSARGRTITQAFYFKLKNHTEGLPKVKGSDDAAKAFWLPLAELILKRYLKTITPLSLKWSAIIAQILNL